MAKQPKKNDLLWEIDRLRGENDLLRGQNAGLREAVAAAQAGQLVVLPNWQVAADGTGYSILYPFPAPTPPTTEDK